MRLKEERMRLVGRHEVLESVFVEMDPVLHGFRGVLVELLGVGESYVLLETAVGTGNRLLRFSSKSSDLAYAVFEAELGSPG
jgi:sporulation-control protein spo0M